MLLIRIENKRFYISTRQVEICSGFSIINMAFNKFSLCKAKHMVLSLSESVLYSHSQE
jgi:hypothetical protein